ncbi:ISLR protein, partial [Malurus elegans]|nr:ISLR protein [Malurus elegans]
CPSPCSCSAKRNGRLLAECAYRELREVPRGLSPNVTILTLSANRLGHLGRGALAEAPELQSLWLGYNRISAVEPGALAALPQLRNLDLSHNRLEEFPWRDLRNLSALQILRLDHNRLARVARDAFAELRQLRSLWLNDNELSVLAEGTLEALPALAQLQLFHNPFECSCKLWWLSRWLRGGSVALARPGSTLCAAPARLRGRQVTAMPAELCVPPSAHLTYLGSAGLAGAQDGLTLTLHCSVAGAPAPEIHWSIRTSSGRRNGTMAVPDFGKDDEGPYTCLAVNELGVRDVSVNVALSGSADPAEELPRDDPRAGQPPCSERAEAEAAGGAEQLLIVYHVRSGAAEPGVCPGLLLLLLLLGALLRC